MRTLALRTLSCALLSIAAVPALAIDQDILLSANLEPSCTLNGSTAPQAVSGEISFTDGQITSAPLIFELPIACNIQASIMIGTLNAGLRTANNTPFSNNRIDYVASVGGGIYVPFFLDTSNYYEEAWSSDFVPAGPPNGTLEVTITPKQPSANIRAGTYTDTLRVRLMPAQ